LFGACQLGIVKAMKPGQQKRRGPPKSFDVDMALAKAMIVFWQKGFDGASLTDLTKAMGINRPSLYATFGDKESLFRRAVARYAEEGQKFFSEIVVENTARRFVEGWLRRTAEFYTAPQFPPGCFFVQSAMTTSAPSQSARRETAKQRRANEMFVSQRLEVAEKHHDLPSGLTANELAAYVSSIGNGLAIRAADGAKREELYRTVDLALAFWPDSPGDADESQPKSGGKKVRKKKN
jgi:AcrR family transcriptional regulator